MSELRLGVIASHNGSTLQAVLDACDAGTVNGRVVVVLSNNSSSYALERARERNIPTAHLSSHTHPDPGELDAAIAKTLRSADVDLVLLAGYMKRIGPETLDAFPGRILNVHPGLLPEFGGRGMYGNRVHEAVLAAGVDRSGATVHVVDPEYDHGDVVAQSEVPVFPGDTLEDLEARVRATERTLYVETVARISKGELTLPLGNSR